MNRASFVLLLSILAILIPGYALIKNYATGSRSEQYPPTKDCKMIFEMLDKDETFMELVEYDKKSTLKGSGIGLYQCYCIKEKKKGIKSETDTCSNYRETK